MLQSTPKIVNYVLQLLPLLSPEEQENENRFVKRLRNMFVHGPEDYRAFQDADFAPSFTAKGRWKMSPFSVDQIPKQTKNSPIQTFLSEYMMHEENAAKFFEGAATERRELSSALFGMRYGASAAQVSRDDGLVVKMVDTSQGASNVMAKLVENATKKPRIPVLAFGDLLDGRPMRTSDELLGGGLLKGDWLTGGVPMGRVPVLGTPSRFSGYFYQQVLERLRREGKDTLHICLEDPNPLADMEADISVDALARLYKYLGTPVMPVMETEIEPGIGKTLVFCDSISHYPTRIEQLFYKHVPALYEKERKKHKHEAAVRRVVKQAKRQGPCDAKGLARYLEKVGAEYEQSKKEAR